MANQISLSCKPGPQTSADTAGRICDEFRSFLAETYPQFSFEPGSTAPAMILTISAATERGLGLDVTWLSPDGTPRPGMPLSTAFFDRNSDETLRKGFFETFVRHNPLPF